MSQRFHTGPAPIPTPWVTARDPRPPAGKPNHPRWRSGASDGRPQTPKGQKLPQPPSQVHSTGPRSHLAHINHRSQEVLR